RLQEFTCATPNVSDESFFKPGEFHFDVVAAGRQTRDDRKPLIGGLHRRDDRAARRILLADHGDRRARQNRARLIDHREGEAAVKGWPRLRTSLSVRRSRRRKNTEDTKHAKVNCVETKNAVEDFPLCPWCPMC